jgi:hypothetical protein
LVMAPDLARGRTRSALHRKDLHRARGRMLVVRGRTRTGRDHRLLPWLLPGYRRQTWKLFVKYSAFEIQYVVVLEVIEAGWGL